MRAVSIKFFKAEKYFSLSGSFSYLLDRQQITAFTGIRDSDGQVKFMTEQEIGVE